MAKKRVNKKEDILEPVTNSCSGKRPIGPSGDQLPVEIVRYDLKNADIESLIRTIRGQKVMVDFDLGMLYGVKTKALNQSVKRNIKRFPDDFMFQLTQDEWNTLRSQIATTKDLSKIRPQIGNKAEIHPESKDEEPRLVFELEYLESLPEYKMLSLTRYWYKDTLLGRIYKENLGE